MANAASHSDDLNALNSTIDRLKKQIAQQPYIQTLPQDGSRWHFHSEEAANAWRRNMPFDANEPAELQYQTFHYHEHGTDLIQLRIHSPPRRRSPSRSRVNGAGEQLRSGTGTPTLSAVKKKISLADYKSQKVAGAKMERTVQTMVVQEEQISGHSGPIADHALKSRPSAKDFAPAGTVPMKRARHENEDDPKDSQSPARRRVARDTEARPSQSPDRSGDGLANGIESCRRNDSHDRDTARMPSPLSPLGNPMPGRLSPIGNVLPEMLSPLPSSVIAELKDRARMHGRSSATGIAPARNSPVRHDTARGLQSRLLASPDPASVDELRRADVQRDKKAGQDHDASPEATNGTKGDIRSTKLDPEDADSNARKRKLLVKLKVPRRILQDLKRPLKIPPHPVKAPAQIVSMERSDRQSTHVAERADESRRALSAVNDFSVKLDNNKPAHKRPISPQTSTRHEPADRGSAKHRRNGSETRPLTPLPRPPPAGSSSQSQTTPQPKKPLPASATMKRISSNDGFLASPTARTPASGTTPAGHPHGTTTATSAPPVSASLARPPPAKAAQGAWDKEAARFLALGRTLKAAGQELGAANSPERALLVTIESFCAFCMSFYCTDRAASEQPAAAAAAAGSAPPVPSTSGPSVSTPAPSSSSQQVGNARKTWLTAHGLWKRLLYDARLFPRLRAVVIALGELYLGRCCAWAASLSSAQQAAIPDLAALHSDVMGLLGRCAAPAPSGPVVSSDAALRLGPGLVRREFGAVWRAWLAQEEGTSSVQQPVVPGKYGGRLDVGVGLGGDVVVAVGTVLALLAGYRCRDGTRFEGSLKLDR